MTKGDRPYGQGLVRGSPSDEEREVPPEETGVSRVGRCETQWVPTK